MPNVTITTTINTNKVLVEFGDYANSNNVDGRKASYRKSDISIVWMEKDDSIVYVKMKDAITTNVWSLSFEETDGAFVVDSIDGVSPTTNEQLFTLLDAI